MNGCVSQAAHLGKSYVVGVMPFLLADQHIFGITRGQLVSITFVSERIACKICQLDAFIVLPGGFGTLKQIFCLISWAKAMDQKFISPSTRKILISASIIEKLLEKLHAYVPQHDPYKPWIDWSKPVRTSIKRVRLS